MPVAAPGGAGQRPQAPGRDGGPSGPSSFLEFWPCCHSDGALCSASPKPPPRSRFPLLLKIRCIQWELTRRRTHAGPPTSSLSPAQEGPRPERPHQPQGFAGPQRLSEAGHPSLAGMRYPAAPSGLSHNPPWGRWALPSAKGRLGPPEAPRAGSPVTQRRGERKVMSDNKYSFCPDRSLRSWEQ